MNTFSLSRAMSFYGLSVGLALACVSAANAQIAGTFDTTFGATNGFVPALVVGSNNDDRANAMALQSDGKIVLAGKCDGALGNFFCMARLNPDGSVDTSFDGPGTPGNGKFLMTVAASLSAGADAVAVQPDGKILVAGTCSGKFCIARLNDNGSFDASFTGIGGTSAGHFALTIGTSTDTLTAMALQADGMIVLAGYCDDGTGNSRSQFCVARLTTSGDFDTAFDGPPPVSPANGRFLIPRIGTNTAVPERAQAVALRTNGKILLAGRCANGAAMFWLVQLNASGTFDSTFDGASGTGNGKVLLEMGGSGFPNTATSIAFQADDSIVLAGTCGTVTCVVRTTPDGVLDASFGGNLTSSLYGPGVADSGIQVPSALQGAVAFDGRIFAAGPPFKISRLNGDGFADKTFDGPSPSTADGFVTLSIAASVQVVQAMRLQPDGKILMAGYCRSTGTSPYTFCVARLNPGPSGARNCTPDIDGDGLTTATVDGLVMTRVMLGLTGTAVTGGITFPVAAPRKTWSAIRSYLVTHCAMSVGP
ncbi:MAG: hypothetical protein ABL985_18560 [Casimicrobium sp.]